MTTFTDEDRRLLRELHAAVVAGKRPAAPPSHRATSAASEPRVETEALAAASDRDLDGQFGDPLVRFAPKGWRGENLIGVRFSKCPAQFLGMLAHALAWSAERNRAEGRDKYAHYDALDAARAAGWRRRLEAAAPPPPSDDFGPPQSDDLFPGSTSSAPSSRRGLHGESLDEVF